jgi:spore coat protein CotF
MYDIKFNSRFEIESDLSENIKKDLYNKNNKILCQIDENQLSQFMFGDLIKICGIVKTKNDTQKFKKDNFFEKIIEIINFSVINKQFDDKMESPNLNKSEHKTIRLYDYDITESEITKFIKIANSGIASSLFSYSLLQGIPSSMDLLKHLLILFIFGNTEKFNFSILNFSNDDNSSLIIKNLGDFMRSSCFYNDFSLDVHSKEDLLNMKKQQNDKNSKFFKIGRIFNAKENMIIFNNLNEKPHENLINVIHL